LSPEGLETFGNLRFTFNYVDYNFSHAFLQ
jgi:hypothetical protein